MTEGVFNQKFMLALSFIQSELKAPKDQKNTFQGWGYRKTEDILEAAKPLLNRFEAAIMLSDRIINVGDRFYVEATATFLHPNGEYSVSGWSREPLEELNKDGRQTKQPQQITGSSSTYARKIALCGLLAIDGSSPVENVIYRDTDKEDCRDIEDQKAGLSDEQVAEILKLCIGINYNTDKLLARYNVKTLYQIPRERYNNILKGISDLKNVEKK